MCPALRMPSQALPLSPFLLAQTNPLGSAELSPPWGPFLLPESCSGEISSPFKVSGVFLQLYFQVFAEHLLRAHLGHRAEGALHLQTVPSLCIGSWELAQWTEVTVRGWDTCPRGCHGAGTLCEQGSTRVPGPGRMPWGAPGTVCARVSSRLPSWPTALGGRDPQRTP